LGHQTCENIVQVKWPCCVLSGTLNVTHLNPFANLLALYLAEPRSPNYVN